MKYIFIDANQYRHIFSRSEGFSDSIYNLLLKLTEKEQVQLLLPQQTKEEIERNKYRKWPESEIKSINNKIGKLENQTRDVGEKLNEYKSSLRLCGEIKKLIKKLYVEQKLIKKSFIDKNSNQNKKLNKLFDRAYFIEENEEILGKSNIRYKKGNPPYDNESIGDSLIWESLLYYFENSNIKKAHLIFVTNDKEAWGENEFDRYLINEFVVRTGGKISYSNKLSDIPELTKEEQEKIRKAELENLKRNAIIDFIGSSSFVSAGENTRKLLKFKKLLSDEDYEEIIKASLSNSQIYQSFFTQLPLTMMVSGGNGYVVKNVEAVDGELWREFASRYNLTCKRQSDGINSSENEINIRDIPF